MLWFACIRDGDPEYHEMYLCALKSAHAHTTLDPYLIYDGSNTAFIASVKKVGATVINHTFSLAHTTYFKRQSELWQRVAGGTYLRLDIPLICQNIDFYDTYALYTDVDILFLSDPVPELEKITPSFFAACPEIGPNNWSYVNAGVLLLNIDAMYSTYNKFMKHVNDTLDIPGFDQTALNTFYVGKIERLPLIYNYKPYWGIYAKDSKNAPIKRIYPIKALASDLSSSPVSILKEYPKEVLFSKEGPEHAISIVHYHGPKPSDIKTYLATGKGNPNYMFLLTRVSNEIWSKLLSYYTFYQTK